MTKTSEKEHIIAGITHGDLNGIGYEVIIKSLMDARIMEMFTPIVYGSSKVASYHRKTLNINDFTFNLIKKADMAVPRRANIINIYEPEIKIDMGVSTHLAGEMAFLALEAAIEDIKKGLIDVLVTAPINKKNIQSDKFNFPGHTEYLAEKFSASDPLMLMVSGNLRIGVVTGHIPLTEVSNTINTELILNKIKILNESLKRDFNIQRPKIALFGLNPHAGDEGLLGNEEIDIIIPAVNQAMEQGILAYGPYAADGFFGSETFTQFDGMLAMYHDQGLLPFKTLAFESGVNYTAGLPFVRTSPAHGTAYELAGKDKASPDAFRAAIYLAIDIYKNRQMFDHLQANALSNTEHK
ncbi:MAG: 4-hydroxythreonine-4-phosphate dehydrogenase PdxA [Lentimicrobiaceae bacterium]|nr:4-hydroxythreonine-4-phosphate dehydrogenase PdxA [Lentimicrobiaceae bacterium]